MIVQCDKCETKFRISDEKVSDSGVKVRCSKCAHVFVVRKDATAALGAQTRSTTVKVKPETLASIASGSQRVASGPGRAPVLPPAAPSGLGRMPNIPSASTTQQAMTALGFGSAPPRKSSLPPVPAFPTNPDQRPSGLPAFPDSTRRELPSFPGSAPSGDRFPETTSEATTEQIKLPASAPPSDPFPKLPSAPGDFPPPDPFAELGSRPGEEPFPKAPSSPGGFPIPSPSSDPFASIGSAPGEEPFPKLPSAAGADPFAQLGSSPGAPPPAFGTDPFADNPSAPDPFAGGVNPLSQPAGTRSDSNPFQNPPAPGPDLHQAGDRSKPSSDPKTGMFPPPPDPERPRTNVEQLVPSGATEDDPFAELENEAPSPGFEGTAEPPPMTDYLPEEEPFPESAPARSFTVARIALGKAGMADGEMSHAKTAIAAAYQEEETAPKGIGAWPTMLGAVAGLAIVLFLFPGLLVGRGVELGAMEELLHIGPRPLLPESLEEVSPEGARVTAYEGREGRRMLVISGIAHNGGPERVERVQAVVLMLDGSEVVERRRAVVGVPLDEADLAKIGNAQDLEDAYRAAQSGASPASLVIEPGANARFVVVFPDIPEHVQDRRFRVEFVKAPVERAEKTDATR